MIRRAFLRGLVFAAAGLAAGTARADPVDEIVAEIREQGFTISRVQRTWLGRVRIVAQNAEYRREVVIDPTTGEIRRDLLFPRKPATGSSQPGSPGQPDLGNSRGIGSIEDEPTGDGSSDDSSDDSPDGGSNEDTEDDDGANWGGGWGSMGEEPAEGGGGEGAGGADAH